ncbi:unnamed protein product, partial [Durusdinium trenchii]
MLAPAGHNLLRSTPQPERFAPRRRAFAAGVGLSAACFAGSATPATRRGVVTSSCVACAVSRATKKEPWRRRKNSQLYRELEEGRASPVEAPRPRQRKPEVLAPAGGWPQLRAAVRNGADAVYFGLDVGLNARARAANFGREDLPEVMKYLHSHGVKAYVTLNTLVFDHELFDTPENLVRAGGGAAIEALQVVAEAKVDALIVQDIGLALLCRELCPEIPVHASTQMSITSAPGALFAANALGATRVVLGRELSLEEITSVAADVGDLEVEVFVHGALCVSYSGQCFSSEAWGGRSANRGQCAQACRLPYGLVKDGELIDLGDAQRYLLSPQDLMALDYVPELIDAGVGCFKIEGRLKGEEYVALTTAAYRQAIDRAWPDDAGGAANAFGLAGAQLLGDARTARTALAQLFARGQDEEHDGLSPGFLEGPKHQRLVRGKAPKHRGVLLGEVRAVQSATASFALQLAPGAIEVPLRPGAGIFFDQDIELGEDAEVLGGTVSKLRRVGAGPVATSAGLAAGEVLLVRLNFGEKAAEKQQQMEAVKVGDLVWRNKDQLLEEQVRQLSLVNLPIFEELDVAPSPRELDHLQPGHPAVLAALQRLVVDAPPRPPADAAVRRGGAAPRLAVLCRTAAQAEAVLQLPRGMVYELQLDFLEAHGLEESVQRAKDCQQRVAVCLPRVLKPNEDRLWRFYQRLQADALLVRSCGALQQLLESKQQTELVGDFSLNAANAVTCAFFLSNGLTRLTTSYDLSAQQICQLAKRLGPERAARLEVVAHQHLPIFHTEHCVFCRFLSNGNDYRDCGHPCERNDLHLRDSNGKDHKVLADMGCRNTVFNAKAQSAAMDLAAFANAQVGFLRLELVDEGPEQVQPLVKRYQAAAAGRLSAEKLWRFVASLPDSNGRRQGVERGSLDDGAWRDREASEMK